MQSNFFVVDALNICKESGRGKARLTILLSLLLELKKNGHEFLCVFDESAYREFKKQGEDIFYNNLIYKYENHFSQARGKTADELIILIAEEKQCLIISNDNYRNHYDKYPWLKNKNRLVKVSVVGGIILAEGIEIKTSEIANPDEVLGKLEPYLAPPVKPSEPKASVSGGDIINQLLQNGFITEEVAQILQHGIDDQVTLVTTQKNEMVAVILVIDKSGSMRKWQDAVIEGQKLMIQGLLGASARFDIRFGQILFNHEVEYFQEISELRDKENPNRTHPSVKVLDKQNYQPGGFTALYDAILKGICSLTPIFYAMQEQGVGLETKVCILTDGMDEGASGTGSKLLPAQLGTAIRYMLDEKLITEISLAGIGDYDYRKIGKAIGISNVIEIPEIPTDSSLSDDERQKILDETERQIRRVFNLWSKTGRTAI